MIFLSSPSTCGQQTSGDDGVVPTTAFAMLCFKEQNNFLQHGKSDDNRSSFSLTKSTKTFYLTFCFLRRINETTDIMRNACTTLIIHANWAGICIEINIVLRQVPILG